MTLAAFIYLIPYALSCAISGAVGSYALRQRVHGATAFGILAWAQASWTFGYIFELITPSVSSKLFWDNVQLIGAAVWALVLLVFVQQYTGRKLPYSRWFFWISGIVFFVMLVLAFTNDLHGLYHIDPHIEPGDPFPALVYGFGTPVWLATPIFFVTLFASVGVLIAQYRRVEHVHRGQMGVIAIGTLLPIISLVLTLFGIRILSQRDSTPFAFALGNLIVAWGLFRYRLFDILPVAHERVIASIPDGVFVIDERNRIVEMNPSALTYLNRKPEQVIGQPVTEVLGDWADILPQFQRVANVQTELTVGEGVSQRDFDVRITPLHNRQGRLTGRVCIVRDVTSQKRAEFDLRDRTAALERTNAELESANEQLRVLSQMKDEFVSNVSHELRTPISSLRLRQHMLRSQPDRVDHHLNSIEREVDRLANLIENLLLLSRLDQNRVTVEPQPTDLNEVMQDYVTDRAPLAEVQGVDLSLEMQSDMPPVLADGNLVGQVLSILLTNAINYTPGGGSIVIRTQHEDRDDGCTAGFSVTDTGHGIPLDEQSQLFSRFFRGKAGRDSGVSGTGLGLAIAHEIIERHNGHISVYSEGIPGKGTTFTIWLPTTQVPVMETST